MTRTRGEINGPQSAFRADAVAVAVCWILYRVIRCCPGTRHYPHAEQVAKQVVGEVWSCHIALRKVAKAFFAFHSLGVSLSQLAELHRNEAVKKRESGSLTRTSFILYK